MRDATAPTTVFGYGSLMNLESLRATVPEAANPRPAYVPGFQRVFNLWDELGWTESNLDLAGAPFCAVNIVADTADCAVNGVTFEVDAEQFAALRRRERDYDVITAQAYDFNTDTELGSCALFSARVTSGTYQFGLPAQDRYLQICASAAESHGNEFYGRFLETTRIDQRRLSEIPDLFQPTGPLPPLGAKY